MIPPRLTIVVDRTMTSVINNEEIVLCVECVDEVHRHPHQLGKRFGSWDFPSLDVEAEAVLKDTAYVVYFYLKRQISFGLARFPINRTNVHACISRASSIWESAFSCLYQRIKLVTVSSMEP